MADLDIKCAFTTFHERSLPSWQCHGGAMAIHGEGIAMGLRGTDCHGMV